MRYRHVKTGAVIDVQSRMGGCWVPVMGSDKPPIGTKTVTVPAKPAAKKKKKTTNEEW